MRGTAKSRQAKPRVDALRLLAQRDALEAIARAPGPLAQLAAIRLRVIRFVLRRYKPNLADIGPAVPFDVVRAELQTEFDARAEPVLAEDVTESLDLELPRTHAPHREASSLVTMAPKLERLRDIHDQVAPIVDETQRAIVERARRIEAMNADFWMRRHQKELRRRAKFGGPPSSWNLPPIPSLVASGMATTRGRAIRWTVFAVALCAITVLAITLTGDRFAELAGVGRWVLVPAMVVVPAFFIVALLFCFTPEVHQGGVVWGWFTRLGWSDIESAHLDDTDGILRIRATRRETPRDWINAQTFTLTIDRFNHNPNALDGWTHALVLSMRACGVKVTTTWEQPE